jgi:Arc/MetJ-type ribon-helix-helix transcriptional regulator
MTVSLSREVEEYIAAKVRTGQFASADEAVNRLLGELRNRETTPKDSSDNGFPVFAVPAGTPTFNADDVRRAEDEP